MSNKNKYLVLVGVATQMGLTIFFGSYFGKYLDDKYPNEKNWFTMILTISSVFISLYFVVQQLKKLNDDDK